MGRRNLLRDIQVGDVVRRFRGWPFKGYGAMLVTHLPFECDHGYSLQIAYPAIKMYDDTYLKLKKGDHIWVTGAGWLHNFSIVQKATEQTKRMAGHAASGVYPVMTEEELVWVAGMAHVD